MPPAKANEPEISRRCINMESDIMPMGMRAKNAIPSSRATPGRRKNAA
jgi:hypothetical protein